MCSKTPVAPAWPCGGCGTELLATDWAAFVALKAGAGGPPGLFIQPPPGLCDADMPLGLYGPRGGRVLAPAFGEEVRPLGPDAVDTGSTASAASAASTASTSEASGPSRAGGRRRPRGWQKGRSPRQREGAVAEVGSLRGALRAKGDLVIAQLEAERRRAPAGAARPAPELRVAPSPPLVPLPRWCLA